MLCRFEVWRNLLNSTLKKISPWFFVWSIVRHCSLPIDVHYSSAINYFMTIVFRVRSHLFILLFPVDFSMWDLFSVDLFPLQKIKETFKDLFRNVVGVGKFNASVSKEFRNNTDKIRKSSYGEPCTKPTYFQITHHQRLNTRACTVYVAVKYNYDSQRF